MTIALIDGDLIAYINAASCEKRDSNGDITSLEPQEIAISRADHHLRDILDATGADQYKIFISGGGNFRYEINPMYKANRTAPDPIHREAVKDFLITEWKASVTDGYEADDALGIAQKEDTIICSIDKDLRMIPGQHYSWPILRKGAVIREAQFVTVHWLEGIKHFYKQMLIGDTSDNIIGVEKIGKVKAAKLIDPMRSEDEMLHTVRRLYANDKRFFMNADCLWIMQEEGVKFTDRYKE